MYSVVIKIAVDVNKAVELVNAILMLGLIIEVMELPTGDPDPIKNSVIINNVFF